MVMYCDARTDVLMIEICTVSTAYIQYMHLTRRPTHRKKSKYIIIVILIVVIRRIK